MANKSQTQLIMAHLNKFGSITPREAMDDYQITRLASRIYDLKNAGVVIDTEMRKHQLTGKRYAKYRLAS